MEKIKLAFYNHRTKISIVCLLIISFFLYLLISNDKKEDVVVETKEEVKDKVKVEDEYIYVDIKGQVKNNGVYKILFGARVIDAIKVAGGLLPDADTSLINLSMKLKDEMAIVIFSKKEVESFNKTKEEFNDKVIECEKVNDACIEKLDDKSDQKLLNINNASINDFMSLPGIGETKAKSIIEYRSSHGLFKNLEELKEVNGIGESIFEKIKEYLTI